MKNADSQIDLHKEMSLLTPKAKEPGLGGLAIAVSWARGG